MSVGIDVNRQFMKPSKFCMKTFSYANTRLRLFNEIINANSQNQPSINATTDIKERAILNFINRYNIQARRGRPGF